MSDMERIEGSTIELGGDFQLPEPDNCRLDWMPYTKGVVFCFQYRGELPNRWYRFWSRVLLNAHWTEI